MAEPLATRTPLRQAAHNIRGIIVMQLWWWRADLVRLGWRSQGRRFDRALARFERQNARYDQFLDRYEAAARSWYAEVHKTAPPGS